VSGVFGFRFEGGIPFRERIGNVRRTTISAAVPGSGRSCARGRFDDVLVPSALVADFPIEFFPPDDFFFGIDEREDSAGVDLDVGMPGKFEHAERVGDFFVAPLIAGDDGDAENVDVGRLQEQKHRLLVGGGGATSILIEDDLAAGLRMGEGGKNENAKK